MRLNQLTPVDGPDNTYEMARELGDGRTLIIVRATVENVVYESGMDPESKPGPSMVEWAKDVMVWIEAYGKRIDFTPRYEDYVEYLAFCKRLDVKPDDSELYDDVSDVMDWMQIDVLEQESNRVAA